MIRIINKELYGWGKGIYAPEKILDDVVLYCGETHECFSVIKSDGSLWMWSTLTENSTPPTKIMGNVKDFKFTEEIHPTQYYNYFKCSIITENNDLWSWNTSSQNLIFIPSESQLTNVIDNVRDFKSRGMVWTVWNDDTFFVTKTDNSLWGWGNNDGGQLGDGTRINREIPFKIMGDITNVFSVANTSWAGTTVIIDTDNNLWTWDDSDPTPKILFENIVTIFGSSLLSDYGTLYEVKSNNLVAIRENVKLPSETVIE